MTGREIPQKDHIVRTASKSKWDIALDGSTVVFSDDLFLPREDYPLGTGQEEYVSVDWLEFFDGSIRNRLDKVRDAVAQRRRSGKVSKQEVFAVVIVLGVKEAAALNDKKVTVATTDDSEDPSHSGIYGLDPTDHIIAQEITRRANSYPAYP